jgi:tetratricopeptide (TPR) repeat protein
VVQAGSDGIFSRAAAPNSFPATISARTGAAVYRAIARVAPAPYVYAMLAEASFDDRDLRSARSYAARLPASPARAELLGRIALADNDRAAASRYFIDANDAFALRAEVTRLARHNLPAGYDLQSRLKDKLARSAIHPDALADAYWELGRLATQRGYAQPARRIEWFEEGIRDYEHAVALAPTAERYLMAAGSQELNLGDPKNASQYFQRVVNQNPASADAYAGLGVSAFRLGDIAEARRYERLSRSYEPHSHFLHTLESLLK